MLKDFFALYTDVRHLGIWLQIIAAVGRITEGSTFFPRALITVDRSRPILASPLTFPLCLGASGMFQKVKGDVDNAGVSTTSCALLTNHIAL